MRVGILLTCLKHLHDGIISLNGGGVGNKISLTQGGFRPSGWSCICVL